MRPMKYNKSIITLVLLLVIIILPFVASATPPDFEGDPGTPIDGGASLLVGAAAVYGIKKIRDKRKQK
jgi:hypothetical protein